MKTAHSMPMSNSNGLAGKYKRMNAKQLDLEKWFTQDERREKNEHALITSIQMKSRETEMFKNNKQHQH